MYINTTIWNLWCSAVRVFYTPSRVFHLYHCSQFKHVEKTWVSGENYWSLTNIVSLKSALIVWTKELEHKNWYYIWDSSKYLVPSFIQALSTSWSCSHSVKLFPCPSWMLTTWFNMDSHFSKTISPFPLLDAAHQYMWLLTDRAHNATSSQPLIFPFFSSFELMPKSENNENYLLVIYL